MYLVFNALKKRKMRNESGCGGSEDIDGLAAGWPHQQSGAGRPGVPVAALQQWPEVVASFIITGEANYLLRVRARNLKQYSAFVLEKLYKARGVLDIRSNIVMQTLK